MWITSQIHPDDNISSICLCQVPVGCCNPTSQPGDEESDLESVQGSFGLEAGMLRPFWSYVFASSGLTLAFEVTSGPCQKEVFRENSDLMQDFRETGGFRKPFPLRQLWDELAWKQVYSKLPRVSAVLESCRLLGGRSVLVTNILSLHTARITEMLSAQSKFFVLCFFINLYFVFANVLFFEWKCRWVCVQGNRWAVINVTLSLKQFKKVTDTPDWWRCSTQLQVLF